MNPLWIIRNIRRAVTVCPTWRDRIHLLRLAYSSKLPRWLRPPQDQPISFRYRFPIGDLKVVQRDNAGSDSFIFGEVFDHCYYDVELQSEPRTILDLGANAGYTAIFFARKFRNAAIACVEPMPNNIAVLRENLLLNGIDAIVFDAAVAVTDGPIYMEMNANDYGHRVVDADMQTVGPQITCVGISVTSLMEQLGWKRIGLLKIDIEGYERFLLKENCGWLRQVDAMCIECHPGYSEADLHELATEYGFCQPIKLPGIWLLRRGPELSQSIQC